MTERETHTPIISFGSKPEAIPEVCTVEAQEAADEAALLSRRKFLGWTGKAAIVASRPLIFGGIGVYLDQKISEAYQSEEVDVGFINRESASRNPHTAMLTLPGFNVYEGFNVGRDVSEGCKDFAQVASLTYGNKEFNIPAIFHAADNFLEKNDIEETYLYGHSMGGMVALEMAGHLQQKGIKVKGIFLDCTPFGKEDIKELDTGLSWLVTVLNECSVYGGMGTNYVIEAVINFIERDQGLLECLQNAKSKLNIENCSNRQAVQILAHGISYDLEGDLRGMSQEVPINYLCPENPANDDVVNVVTAYSKLARSSQNPTKRIWLPGTGHADPGAHPKAYHAALRSALTPVYDSWDPAASQAGA